LRKAIQLSDVGEHMSTSKRDSPEQRTAGLFATLQPWAIAVGLCVACAVVTGATGTWDHKATARIASADDTRPCVRAIDADHPRRADDCADVDATAARGDALAATR
jgi:hypothetical protein